MVIELANLLIADYKFYKSVIIAKVKRLRIRKFLI